MILCSIGPLLPLLHLLEILYYNFKQILIKREKGIWGGREGERERGRGGGRDAGTDDSALPMAVLMSREMRNK
jgi:hypothetical protein